jgi:exo-1,4-beta-D-glucosaminidase
VISALETPSLKNARLTVMGTLTNGPDKPVKGVLKGSIGKIKFSQKVELKAGETRQVAFAPDQFPQLELKKPRLWWPYQMGGQEMYGLKMEFVIQGKISDRKDTRFGIREVTSEFIKGEPRVVLMDGKPVTPTPHHSDTGETEYRVFKVNGKRILIRGAGWAPDMLFNTTPEREEQEIRYVRDMGLNALRFEGSVLTQNILDLCDRYGILVMSGWTCECHWERWADWSPGDAKIAEDSLRSEVRRLLNHPCVFVWLNGSDYFPPPEILKRYMDVLEEEKWPNPSIGSARGYDTLQGKTGVKMRGPYQYEPPLYWYQDQDRGGASFGFNTETSCGPAVPPVESLRKMIPADRLWPPNEFWTYHCCGGAFSHLAVHDKGMEDRYGKAESLEEYVLKAQVLAYDGHRAMFEAYGKFKYRYATGVIQWMLNNGWPSFYWHLYDYYLRPGSSYFAAKKANEALHIQYSYEDRSVVVLNNLYRPFRKVQAKARVFDFNLREIFSKEARLDLGPDSSNPVFLIPDLKGLTATYFLRLDLTDSKGNPLSANFYWLSVQKETMNYEKPEWCYTPALKDADMTMLNQLPKVRLEVKSRHGRKGKDGTASVVVKNKGKHLAFFIRLKVVGKKDGEEALPVLWRDNYFSLLPGETRRVEAVYPLKELHGKPLVEVEGWNVEKG